MGLGITMITNTASISVRELWEQINNNYSDLLFNLYERWQEEKEYEDINEYLKVIQRYIPQAFKITKRPFAITCRCSDGNMQVSVKRVGNYVKLFGKNV